MGTEETPEGIEVPLVVYKGNERIVIGTAWVNTNNQDIHGYGQAIITAEIDDPEIMSRLQPTLGEFSFGIQPTNSTLNKFKDVNYKYDIWDSRQMPWVPDGPTIERLPDPEYHPILDDSDKLANLKRRHDWVNRPKDEANKPALPETQIAFISERDRCQ